MITYQHSLSSFIIFSFTHLFISLRQTFLVNVGFLLRNIRFLIINMAFELLNKFSIFTLPHWFFNPLSLLFIKLVLEVGTRLKVYHLTHLAVSWHRNCTTLLSLFRDWRSNNIIIWRTSCLLFFLPKISNILNLIFKLLKISLEKITLTFTNSLSS